MMDGRAHVEGRSQDLILLCVTVRPVRIPGPDSSLGRAPE